MDPLQEVKDEIQSVQLSAGAAIDVTKAKLIVNLLDNALSEHEDTFRSRIPPLDIIIYAIKGILYPTPIYEQTPNLIHLFTMVEFHRLRAINTATNALSVQSYYQDNPDPNVILLSGEAEGYFKAILDSGSSAEWRAMFMKIISVCSMIDVLQVWFHDSDTDFWLRWNEYFSILDREAEQSAKISHEFQHVLSMQDILQLRSAIVHCIGVLERVEVEIEGRAVHSQSYEQAIESKEFQDDVHLPQMDTHFLKVVDTYLTAVHGMVEYVAAKLQDEQQ